jgi:hypothetical protein
MSAGAPLPPNPAYQNVPPPPVTSGNTVVKIVLIVIGAFVLLGVIVAGAIGIGVYRLTKSVRTNSDDGVSLSTPNGTITTGTSANVGAADLGIALYPGVSAGEGSMNMKTPNGSMVTAVYTSTDAPDKIIAFYRAKLGESASIVQNNNGAVLSAGEKDKDNVVVTITPEDNGTKIAILHVTNNKSE